MQNNDEKIKKMHMGRLIYMMSHQMKRESNSVASTIENDDLTIMQKHVLKFVLMESLHRDIYQKDIEEEFQIRKSTVTGILKLMEKHGYVYRENVKKDARLKRIVPTRKAEKIRSVIIEHIEDTECHLVEGITEEEVLICKKTLCKMYQNLIKMYHEDNKEAKKEDE